MDGAAPTSSGSGVSDACSVTPALGRMEGGATAASASASAAAAMEERFAGLCKSKLALNEGTTRQAMQLFKETRIILQSSMSSLASGSPEEIERSWSACVLYCVSKLSTGEKAKTDGGITLRQILRAFELKIVDFFKEMPQFCIKVGFILTGLYGSDWEKRLELQEMQADIVHLCSLGRYYKRAYEELFLSNDGKPADNSSEPNAQQASEHYRFGWLLFLSLRIQTNSRAKNLLTSTTELVSVLAVLIIHIPVRLRNFSIQDSSCFAKKSDKGVKLIASLCERYLTSEDELRKALEKTNTLIMDILKKKPCSDATELQQGNLSFIDPEGLTFFKKFLEEDSLKSSLQTLEKEYENALNTKGELDERMFANDEDSLLGSGSLSGGAIKLPGTKRKYDVMTSPTKSTTSRAPMSPPRFCPSPTGNSFCNSKIAPSTPVSTAMTTAKWLRCTISPLPSRPSGELLRFFSACDKDVTDDITCRAAIILGAIFTGSSFGERMCTSVRNTNGMDAIWTEQRKMEALKLYYRVLESMCRAESQILSGSNLTSLLSNERFHRCMIACSAELVLATHKTVTMMFPAVLEKTGITAFDLSKVIESFVRHEDTLPRELKRHLNSLEERLLESLAWEKGSSMYNSLIVARPALSAEINRLSLLAEPMPSLDAIVVHHDISLGGLPPLPFQKQERLQDKDEVRSPKRACTERRNVLVDISFRSPVKDTIKSKSLPPLQSAFASPTRPNPAAAGETCAETGIGVFLSKIAKLAAIRIKGLCEKMNLSQQTVERVYSLVQQIINHQTALFFNRHIDQIILCSIYGVAKISKLALTFKEIIFSYRKQPHCKPQVFRSVYVHWPSRSRSGKIGADHLDIITFYNEVFIPTVKPLLVDLGPCTSPNKNSEEKSASDAPFPESPRLARFPTLPDMSPKKVSATRNVYVSPLRTSKMDTLLSPSSKSYYACVGESTQAFQSPSKDLKAINTRLNSGKKVNGKLNFDVDVFDDLVVARSLSNQNGSSAAPVAVLGTKTPVKCEQTDS
ncbi:hypothetical protein ACQ4PT_045381 [Festuca glaucescens]